MNKACKFQICRLYDISAVRTVIVPAAYNIFLISNLCVT